MKAGEALGRWREPAIADPAAFYAAHPECVVSQARIEELAPHIAWRVRQLERGASADRREELAAALRLRIIEAATGYRRRDPETGRPVYDYLEQANKYIAHHAAIKVYSELRRERRRTAQATRLAELNTPGPPDISDNPLPARTPEALISRPALGSDAEFADLASGIARQLTDNQLRIFRLLVIGNSPAEIGRLLGMDRRRVHEHVKAIRLATRAFLDGVPAPERKRRPISLRRRVAQKRRQASPQPVRQLMPAAA